MSLKLGLSWVAILGSLPVREIAEYTSVSLFAIFWQGVEATISYVLYDFTEVGKSELYVSSKKIELDNKVCTFRYLQNGYICIE